ncbi:N-6 DNA methylase [Rhodanobacter caeni]|uniref:site-specific DNA-methyltransferase (adenine-specific) n=1 Tax=Rhodanobacter caeni TaxID=657654 RepID=A0ABP3E643_9GAMM
MAHAENAKGVLFEVSDRLRNSPLGSHECGLLAFQLLAWGYLEQQGRLDSAESIDDALERGAAGVLDALKHLESRDAPIGQAFDGASRRAHAVGNDLVPATVSTKRLTEGGIFERFSPVDIANALEHDRTMSFVAPQELAALMVSLTVSEGCSSIYCPWETAGRLVGALLQSPSTIYVEAPYAAPVSALLSLFRHGATEIVITDPLRAPTALKSGRLRKFGATLSLPPWNMQLADDVSDRDLYGRFPIKKANGNGLSVQHIVAQTDGRAAVVVPNGFLFGLGRDRDVREDLLNKGLVEAVIALPPGLLQGTNISSALLLLNTQTRCQSVGLVDATQPHFAKVAGKGVVGLSHTEAIIAFCQSLSSGRPELGHHQLDETMARTVSVSEILANDAVLQVDRYVMAQEQRAAQAALDALPTAALDDVVHSYSPVPNKDRGVDSVDAIEVYEVGAADLPSTGYIRHPEKKVTIQLNSRRPGYSDEVFLRAHDLVLITKGSTGKIGIVPDNVPPPGPGGWIAGQSAAILRSRDPRFDARGLGLWLRSEMGQQLLAGIKAGATVPLISLATLRKLMVPVLTPEWIGRAIDALRCEDEIQHQIEALEQEQRGIASALWQEFLQSTAH